MESPLISVKNVSKTFAGVKALNNIDLEIAPGEIHCLAGENGSGKSTLIKVISGVHGITAFETFKLELGRGKWNSWCSSEMR